VGSIRSQEFQLIRVFGTHRVSADQYRVLEEIFQGKRGGPWGVIGTLITTWLPTQELRIEIQAGNPPSFVSAMM
jgi:hypothetical protein